MKFFPIVIIMIFISCDTPKRLQINGSSIHEEKVECGYISIVASSLFSDNIEISFKGCFDICPCSLKVKYNGMMIDISDISFYFNENLVRDPDSIIQTASNDVLFVKIKHGYPIKYSKDSYF